MVSPTFILSRTPCLFKAEHYSRLHTRTHACTHTPLHGRMCARACICILLVRAKAFRKGPPFWSKWDGSWNDSPLVSRTKVACVFRLSSSRSHIWFIRSPMASTPYALIISHGAPNTFSPLELMRRDFYSALGTWLSSEFPPRCLSFYGINNSPKCSVTQKDNLPYCPLKSQAPSALCPHTFIVHSTPAGHLGYCLTLALLGHVMPTGTLCWAPGLLSYTGIVEPRRAHRNPDTTVVLGTAFLPSSLQLPFSLTISHRVWVLAPPHLKGDTIT